MLNKSLFLYLLLKVGNESITDLDLSWNSLRNKGAEAIGKALSVSSFVISSIISSCHKKWTIATTDLYKTIFDIARFFLNVYNDCLI